MNKNVLFINLAGYMSLPSGQVLRIIADKFEVHSVTDRASALAHINSPENLDTFVLNGPDLEIITLIRQKKTNASIILMTDLPMQEYSNKLGGKEETLVDQVIANRLRERWAVDQLRVALNKLATNDIFGIDKYLAPGTKIHQSPITCSKDRDVLNNRVMEFATDCHLGIHTSKLAFGICEEMLMNTIYDAPIAAGITAYENIPRTESIELKKEEQGSLVYACDGDLFVIAAIDPFGALEKQKLFTYLKKVLKRSESEDIIDTKKGGAGLGLFKILYSSHALICNVEKKKRTEIIAVIDLAEQLRDFSIMPRSINYFGLPR